MQGFQDVAHEQGLQYGVAKWWRNEYRSALNWWASIYSEGVRISIVDSKWKLERVVGNPCLRIQATAAFGVFPANPEDVQATQAIADGLREHATIIKEWLSSKFPFPYAPFAAHLLTLSHEADAITSHALHGGHSICAMPTRFGHVLVYHGPVEAANSATATGGKNAKQPKKKTAQSAPAPRHRLPAILSFSESPNPDPSGVAKVSYFQTAPIAFA